MSATHRQTRLSHGHADGFCLEVRDFPRWRWLASASTELLLIGPRGLRLGGLPVVGRVVHRIVNVVDHWAHAQAVHVLQIPLHVDQARTWDEDFVGRWFDSLVPLGDGLLEDEKYGDVFDDHGRLIYARCLVCNERLAASGKWSNKVHGEHKPNCEGPAAAVKTEW